MTETKIARIRSVPKTSNMTPDELAILAAHPEDTAAEAFIRYRRLMAARYRARDPVGLRDKRLAKYARDKDRIRAKAIAWLEANPERAAASQAKYNKANKAKRIASLDAWRGANPDKHKAAVRKWVEDNRHVMTASAAKIRAKAIEATPAWADWKEIEKVYNAARKMTRRTGIVHQVDHIIPLNGKTVRGLHVHYNLQVITKAENLKKRNHLIEV